MGLLDALFGRRKLPSTRADRLGQIVSAEVAIRTDLNHEPTGQVGLAVKSVAASSFDRVAADVERMLTLAGHDLGSEISTVRDEHGYVWLIATDPDFPDLVAEAQVAAETLKEEGYGEQLLACVFPFRPAVADPTGLGGRSGGPGATDELLYVMYAFKRGTFYAFAPRAGQKRDLALELRVHAVLERELPLEADLAFRYPMWGIPLR